MNKEQLGKLTMYNAVIGIVAAFMLVLLTFLKIAFNPLAWILLDATMATNIVLSIWNWRLRKYES